MYLSQVTSMVDLGRMKYFHIYVSRLKESVEVMKDPEYMSLEGAEFVFPSSME